MAVAHPEKLVMAIPNNRLDQIVDILTGSVSVGAAPASNNPALATATRTPVSPDYYYTKGLWSYDNGATWLEMGNQAIVGTDNVVGYLTLSTSITSPLSTDVTGPLKILINANNHNPASGYTILYKVIVMARFDQELIGVKVLAQPLRYSSKNKYMKVAKEGKVVLPTSGITTIAHNLGYIPNFNAWQLYDDTPASPGAPDVFLTQSYDSVYVDTVNLYCSSNSTAGSINGTLYYRIYLNA